jgi:hypothetical protein
MKHLELSDQEPQEEEKREEEDTFEYDYNKRIWF